MINIIEKKNNKMGMIFRRMDSLTIQYILLLHLVIRINLFVIRKPEANLRI